MSEKRYVRMPRKAFLSLMRMAWVNAGQTAGGNYKWVDDTGAQKPRYTKSDKPPQARGEKQQDQTKTREQKQQQQATAKAERQKQKEAARQAKEQEKAANTPEAKKAKAQELIQSAIENGVQGEQVLALVDALLSVRVKDLKEIRASLGAKGGQTKSEITKKISAKIVEKALGEQKPQPAFKPSPAPLEPKQAAKPADPAKIQSTILDSIKNVPIESIADLRDKMPEGMSGKEFDAAILQLADDGKVKIGLDDTASKYSPEDRERHLQEGDNLYTYIMSMDKKSRPAPQPKQEAKPVKPQPKPTTPPPQEAPATQPATPEVKGIKSPDFSKGPGEVLQTEKTKDGKTFSTIKSPFHVPSDAPPLTDVPADAKEVVVPLSDLQGTQEYLHLEVMQSKNSDDPGAKLPVVLKKGGIFYIQDGHHRLAKAGFDGKETARVVLVDMDKNVQSQEPQKVQAKANSQQLDKLKGMAQKADEAHQGGVPLDDFEVQIYAQQAASMMKDMSDKEAIALAKAFGVAHNLNSKADAIKRVKEKVLEGPRIREKIRY